MRLSPVEDRRKLDPSRERVPEGFSPGNYLLLVDYTGGLFRDGKSTEPPTFLRQLSTHHPSGTFNSGDLTLLRWLP